MPRLRRHVVTVFGKCMPDMGLACDERAADPVTTWQRVALASSRQAGRRLGARRRHQSVTGRRHRQVSVFQGFGDVVTP